MPLKLETLISSKTLPKTVFSISLITLVLLAGLLYFSNYQTENRHENYLSKFQDHLESRITSLQTEITNLAQNGLIINSLIDFDFLERSLPVFLNSLKLSVDPIEIGFTDFKGELVTSNSKSLEESVLKFSDWNEMVLKNAQSYLRFNQGTLFIGEPILYANMPEGALIAYVNNFSKLIGNFPSGSNDIIVLDNKDKILYSSNLEKFPLDLTISSLNFEGYYTTQKQFLEWKIISLEPWWQSYKALLPLVIFLLICIAAVLISTFASVRLASSLASKSVHELQKSYSARHIAIF